MGEVIHYQSENSICPHQHHLLQEGVRGHCEWDLRGWGRHHQEGQGEGDFVLEEDWKLWGAWDQEGCQGGDGGLGAGHQEWDEGEGQLGLVEGD